MIPAISFAFASCFALPEQPVAPREAVALVAPITEVSLFEHAALVTRHAELPAGGGRFVVDGLSGVLVPDSVRLRLTGGEASHVEVRESVAAPTADARLAELRARREARADTLAAATDRLALAEALRSRLERLFDQEAAAHAAEVARGQADPARWAKNLDFLDARLAAARHDERAASDNRSEAQRALEQADQELGALAGGARVRTYRVEFDVVPQVTGPLALALDYLVGAAGWQPRYDLRADAQLRQVDLVYRAEVHQQTGEDWRAVGLWLSTAQPQRGVVGPEAKTAWFWLSDGDDDRGRAEGRKVAELSAALERRADFDDAKGQDTIDAPVENAGLSVRYHLPRPETVESRAAPATVLVGRATLAVVGERVCTPALDPSVWVRGRATNSSDYVLLPGTAAVYFGNDFLGESRLTLVRPGQEFTLHLGLDAGLAVKRTHVEDHSGSAGFFGGRKSKVDRWRIELENHGALALGGDAGAMVQVREVLPKAEDDRIEVELVAAEPAPAGGPRFAREREESGVLTWELRVPSRGSATVDWSRRITWPKDQELAGSGSVALAAPRWPPFVAGAVLLIGVALATWRRRRGARSLATALLVVSIASGTLAPQALAQDAVASRIARVTVYGQGALVERDAVLPGSGRFLLRDLPAAADPQSFRVRLTGGEVVGVEVRERQEPALPEARLEALRTRVRELEAVVAARADDDAVLRQSAAHLQKLLQPALPPAPPAIDGARPDADAWAREQAFLAERIAANQDALRKNGKALAAAQASVAAARAELESGAQPSVRLRDLLVDVVAPGGSALPCTVLYLVGDAGWEPTYEVRAAADLSHATLGYQARVWQQSSETWSDVALALSTAQPQRGAQGPDPRPERLTLHDPRHIGPSAAPSFGLVSGDAAVPEEKVDRAAAAQPVAPPPFATVVDQGLSVRFAIAGAATIPSRADGQVVLIGRTDLPLAPRRTCVPAQDPTVWLSAQATNASDWLLLPGATAVHLGNDYLGRGRIELTQKGQSFELHLGPDPFVAVERVRLDEALSTSAFSSNGTRREAWRLRFENHGAPTGSADGAVVVDVLESLPKSRDERIAVRLEAAQPSPADGDDERKLREERGLLTWHLPLARGQPTQIEWSFTVRYPARWQLHRADD